MFLMIKQQQVKKRCHNKRNTDRIGPDTGLPQQTPGVKQTTSKLLIKLISQTDKSNGRYQQEGINIFLCAPPRPIKELDSKTSTLPMKL
jgi:hypothetical protein